MQIFRSSFMALCLIAGTANSAFAHADISINLSFNPDLVAIPGYPVYYAPQVDSNYFFYDGNYWLYQNDDWYVSNWYNGPWEYVDRDAVPVFILRVPVRYYRRPPVYFNGWRGDEPPHWGSRWGNEWEHRHDDWNRWDRNRAPARTPAPAPTYRHDYPDNHQAPPQRDGGDNNSPSRPGWNNNEQRTFQPRISQPQRMPQPQARPPQNYPARNAPPQPHRAQEQRQGGPGNDRDRGNGQNHGDGQGSNR